MVLIGVIYMVSKFNLEEIKSPQFPDLTSNSGAPVTTCFFVMFPRAEFIVLKGNPNSADCIIQIYNMDTYQTHSELMSKIN